MPVHIVVPGKGLASVQLAVLWNVRIKAVQFYNSLIYAHGGIVMFQRAINVPFVTLEKLQNSDHARRGAVVNHMSPATPTPSDNWAAIAPRPHFFTRMPPAV